MTSCSVYDSNKKNINVEYDVCSIEYNCSSEFTGALANAIHFNLPDRHKGMYITFITGAVGEFQQDITQMATNYPSAKSIEYAAERRIGNTNEQDATFCFDAASAAINVASRAVNAFIAYYETGDYRAGIRRMAEIVSGYTSVTYHYVVYDSSGRQLFQGIAPGGIKITLFCGESASKVDFYATESGNVGTIAYENAYEVDTTEYSVDGGTTGKAYYKYYGDIEVLALDDLHLSYNELKRKYGDNNLLVKSPYNSTFHNTQVKIQKIENEKNGLTYIYMTYGNKDPIQDGYVFRVEGLLQDMMGDITEMDITEFASKLKSVSSPAHYKIWEGRTDGIEDKHIFGDVFFGGNDESGEDGAGYGGRLRIIVNNDYKVTPKSRVQLEIIAG